MPPRSKYPHRTQVYLGDFDLAILEYLMSRLSNSAKADHIRDGLRVHCRNHARFDSQDFAQVARKYGAKLKNPDMKRFFDRELEDFLEGRIGDRVLEAPVDLDSSAMARTLDPDFDSSSLGANQSDDFDGQDLGRDRK